MGWLDADVYNTPENFDLTVLGGLGDPEASYSFNYLMVWEHKDGRIFYASDSGCSCPSPFEDYTKLEDLGDPVTDDNFQEFQDAVMAHCNYTLPDDYHYYEGKTDSLAADRVELLANVSHKLRLRKKNATSKS